MRSPSTRQVTSAFMSALVVGSAACLSACSGNEGRFHVPDQDTSAQQAALTRAGDCESLLKQFQNDAAEKIEMRTAELLRWELGGHSDGPVSAPGTREGVDAGVASSADDAVPDDFSETNVQVQGVDEADFVKTTGERIYLLQGTHFAILDSWPANETSLLGSAELEGTPVAFFLHDGRAVVFASVPDPRTADSDRCDGLRGCYWGPTVTKATVLRLDNDVPAVERELFFEGNYRDSRRYDDTVRLVLQTWGTFHRAEIPEPYSFLYDEETGYRTSREQIYAWRAAALTAVGATTLEDWLPARWERAGDDDVTLPSHCDGFHTPAPGHTSDGLVQVVGFDMTDSSSDVSQTAISGYAQNVYSNLDTMLITQPDHGAWWRAYQQRVPSFSSWSLLHKFALDDRGGARYVASGVLPGDTNNQFALEAREDAVFAATTQWHYRGWWLDDGNWVAPESSNHLVALAGHAGQRLSIVGRTPPLAPGETVQAARFIGDIAYVVTFRQVDPLFAIDIQDPTDLNVLGELKIEGFSTYMHPLDDTHLLTIGFDADATGVVQGLALQIFDVTQPADPQLAHKYTFRDRWGYSQATWDHKAFSFFPSRSLLSFPYQAWSERDFRSSLEVLHIDATTGIRPLASIDHTGALTNVCPSDQEWGWGCWGDLTRVRRGLFIEDYVYSISHGAVQVHDTRLFGDGDALVGEVPLPQDGVRNYYHWWW